MKTNKYYILGFLLGLFTFLVELILLRQMSIFFGSGIKATGLLMFLFILGMGIGDILALKNFRSGRLIIAICSISLILIVLAPQIIYQLPIQKNLVAILFSLLITLPGIISGYFYAIIIRSFNKDSIIVFILTNTFGSLLGCLLSFVLLKFMGVKEILLITAFILLLFIIKRRILFMITLAVNLLLLFFILSYKQEVNPAVYHQILTENQQFTFPPELMYGQINTKNIIFNQPSSFGQVIVDNQYNLYIHNVLMCGKNLNTEKIINPQVIRNANLTAKNVLIVGLGCGATLAEYLKQNNDKNLQVVVIEINPVVIEAQKLFYKDKNPVSDPRVTLLNADGYDYLTTKNQKFDTIFVDLSDPISLESSRLYTADFTKLLFSQVADSGRIIWRSIKTLSDYDRILYGNIRSVFPYVIIKHYDYAMFYYASKTPFFIEITRGEADIMNRYESLPFMINSIDRPVIK